jgi:hypothetical protein
VLLETLRATMDEDLQTISAYFDIPPDNVKRCAIHTSVVVGASLEEVMSVLGRLVLGAKGKVETYSDKAVVVRETGLDPLAIPGLMTIGKDLRGGVAINPGLRGGAGWVFPKYLKPRIQGYLIFGEESPLKDDRGYTRKDGMYAKLRRTFGFTPKPISGREAIDAIKKAILPDPSDSEIYAKVVGMVNPGHEYKSIQLLSMFYDLFYPVPPKIGNLQVHTFQPDKTPKIVYWVSGPEEEVKRYISKIEDEHPYQGFVAKVYPSKEGYAEGWMEHWTSD